MNTIDQNQPRPKPSRLWRTLRWMAVATGVSAIVVIVAVIYTITLDGDARRLRQSVMSALGVPVATRVQIHAGPALLSAARVLVRAFDRIPPPAQLALDAVQSASVGVYQLDARADREKRSAVLTRSDQMMNRRGWTRIVGVDDHDSIVLVYAENEFRSASQQRVCIAVIERNDLIIVSARADLEKLANLANIRDQLHRL